MTPRFATGKHFEVVIGTKVEVAMCVAICGTIFQAEILVIGQCAHECLKISSACLMSSTKNLKSTYLC